VYSNARTLHSPELRVTMLPHSSAAAASATIVLKVRRKMEQMLRLLLRQA